MLSSFFIVTFNVTFIRFFFYPAFVSVTFRLLRLPSFSPITVLTSIYYLHLQGESVTLMGDDDAEVILTRSAQVLTSLKSKEGFNPSFSLLRSVLSSFLS